MRKQQQRLIKRLLRASETMVQGGLSETSRRCGNPGCACYHDPERLHGPHLYITYREDGKSRLLGDRLFSGQVQSRPPTQAVATGEAIAHALRGPE